jgi:hypothetical protein
MKALEILNEFHFSCENNPDILYTFQLFLQKSENRSEKAEGTRLSSVLSKVAPRTFSKRGKAPAAWQISEHVRRAGIYRENRIQESEVRSQKKSGSSLFSWMGAAPPP